MSNEIGELLYGEPTALQRASSAGFEFPMSSPQLSPAQERVAQSARALKGLPQWVGTAVESLVAQHRIVDPSVLECLAGEEGQLSNKAELAFVRSQRGRFGAFLHDFLPSLKSYLAQHKVPRKALAGVHPAWCDQDIVLKHCGAGSALQEVRALLYLNGAYREGKAVKSVPHLYHAQVEGNEGVLSMQGLRGVNLETLLRNVETTREGNLILLNAGMSLAQSLASVHAVKGVIHRDIKSKNTMVCTDNTTKIVDFECTSLPGDPRLMPFHDLDGTMLYASRELVSAEDLNQGTDIWSLGVVLYELLSARRNHPMADYLLDNGGADKLEDVEFLAEEIKSRFHDDYKVLINGYIIGFGEKVDERIRALLIRMFDTDSGSRPKAQEVYRELRAISNLLRQKDGEAYQALRPEKLGSEARKLQDAGWQMPA